MFKNKLLMALSALTITGGLVFTAKGMQQYGPDQISRDFTVGEPENIDRILRYIRGGGDLNIINDIGETLLHRACHRSVFYDIALELINRGLDVNARDCYGFTPLKLAIEILGYGGVRIGVVRLLLENGANPDDTFNFQGPAQEIRRILALTSNYLKEAKKGKGISNGDVFIMQHSEEDQVFLQRVKAANIRLGKIRELQKFLPKAKEEYSDVQVKTEVLRWK